MKKILSLVLAVLMIASCVAVFTLSVSAAEPIVFTAGQIKGTAYRLSYEEATVDGMNVLKVVPKDETAVPKIDKLKLNASPAEYKYVKIIFKTNYNYNPIVFDFQAGTNKENLGKQYRFTPKAANKWVGAIIELEPSLATSDKVYNQVHIWAWGNEGGSALLAKGAELYIESWGFFSTLDEAKAYNKDKYEIEQLPGEEVVAPTAPATPVTPVTPEKPSAPVETVKKEIVPAEPKVFSGKAIMATPYRIVGEEVEVDGVKALKVVPTQDTTVPKMDRYSIGASADNYAYAKVIFKTNFLANPVRVWFVSGNGGKKLGGTYDIAPQEANKWIGAILQLNPENVGSGNKYEQAHIWAWGDASANSLHLQGAEAYFESFAFFSTLEEAMEYNKDKYEIEQILEFKSTADNTKAPVIEAKNLVPNRDMTVYGTNADAGVASGDPIVITSSDMLSKNALYDPEKNISYPATAGDEGSARMTFVRDTSVGKMQFTPATVVGIAVDKSIYKYFKVGYKYHLTNPDGNYKMMLREGHSGASTNHTLFELPKGKNDQWIEQYCMMTWGTSKEEGMFTLHPVREGDKVAAGDYFDFAYIAFFTSEEEAKAYTIGAATEEDVKGDTATHTAYMTGYADGTFKPNKTMTRAEACTVVARLLDTEENIAKNTATAFSDVTAGKWYTKYVSFCEAKGLLGSYSGTFAPEQNITRAEFAELVYNTGLAKENAANKKTFTDVPETHPRYTAIMAAASAGLVGGYEDGTFLPDRTITRAQVVTIINRALGRVINEFTIPHGATLISFSDVAEDFWAYNAIAEATNTHEIYSDIVASQYNGEIWKAQVVTGDAASAKLAEVDALWNKRKEEILNSKDELTVTGTKYYVSATGSASSPGTDPANPRSNVPGNLKAGDGVFFKRGDTFRMYLYCVNGVTYGAYGEGAKPRILGSPKNYAESKWSAVEGYTNVYVCDEVITSDVGLVVLNDGEKWADKIWSAKASEITLDKLTKNDTFVHLKADGKVYLRCDEGNPAEVYKQIDFNVKKNIVSGGAKDLRLDNLCFMYTGAHGIGDSRDNTVITNCVFGFIGGSQQNDEARYGNAIEFWGPTVNSKVYNCYIYQVYDAGLTFQMKGNGTAGVAEGFDGVVFDNNLVEKCAYNIEYFARDYKDNLDVIANCTISNNILRDAGVGICRSAPDAGAREAAIKGWDTKNQAMNFVIKNNIFDRSTEYLIHIGSLKWDVSKQTLGARTPEYLPIMQGNVYIQNRDTRIAQWNTMSVKGEDDAHYNLSVRAACENTSEIYILDK